VLGIGPNGMTAGSFFGMANSKKDFSPQRSYYSSENRTSANKLPKRDEIKYRKEMQQLKFY
jgi:hypothetical protein